MSWRGLSCFATLLSYVLLTLAVMLQTPVLTVDNWLYGLHLHVRYPQYNRFALDYVMLGQRGPASLVRLP